MRIRNKLKRRMVILLAGICLTCAAAGGFYVYRKSRINAQYAQWRTSGLNAARSDNYQPAIDTLSQYLQRYPEDEEVLVEYAKVRPLVALPQGEHLAQTISVLRHLLKYYPARIEQRCALLDLYAETGYVTETIETATAILREVPSNAKALAHRSRAHARLRDFGLALTDAQQWREVAPGDIKASMTVLYLMQEEKKPAAEILSVGQGKAGERPGSDQDRCRLSLLEGYAHSLVGERAEAVKHLRIAAEYPVSDPDVGAALVRQLDVHGLSAESLIVLERLAKSLTDAPIRHALAKRYWELGRNSDIPGLLADLNAGDLSVDSELCALRAMALLQNGGNEEAATVQKALANRRDDLRAAAWAAVLDRAIQPGRKDSDVRALIAACRAAADRNVAGAYVHYFLGEAYYQIGERDQAISAWREAKTRSLTWPAPGIRLAEALTEAGRYTGARDEAVQAVNRAPKHAATVLGLMRVVAAGVEKGNLAGADALMKDVDAIQAEFPGEEHSLTIKISLLARSDKAEDRQKAADVLKAALASKSPLSQDTLLRLAAISRATKLGLENKCYVRSEKDHGLSPAIAYAMATTRYVEGDAAGGLRVLENGMSKPGQMQSVAWRIAWAKYLELAQDERARPAVMSLADEHAKDLTVQRFAIASQTASADPAFADKVIERLKSLTGDDAQTWRIAKARRLLLRTQNGLLEEAAAKEAADLLTPVVRNASESLEARLLMAQALERVGDAAGAIEHATVAVQLAPQEAAIRIQLVRLLQSTGDLARARDQLDSLATARFSDTEQRRQAAVLFTEQGEVNRAIELLQGVEGGASFDLALAQLYRLKNQLDKAEEICKELLSAATPDPAAVAFAADLYAAQGRTSDAKKTLERLDALQLQPGLKSLIRADFESRFGSLAQARQLLQSAVVEAPQDAAPWRALIGYEIGAGNIEEALAVINKARTALPEDKSLQQIQSASDFLRAAGADRSLVPLAAALVRDPTEESPALKALQAYVRNRGSPDRAVLAAKLDEVSRKHPKFMPLNSLLAQLYLTLDKRDAASAVTARAVQASPSALDPVRLSAQVFIASGRWAEALDAATTWRAAARGGDVSAAEVTIARAYMGLGQPASAVRQLAVHVRKSANGEADADMVGTYCQAAELAGDVDAAQLYMEPLLSKHKDWRRNWCRFVLQNLNEERACHWLKVLSQVVRAQSTDERVMVAEAWVQLGSKWSKPAYADNARVELKKMVEAEQPAPNALLAAAVREELDGNLSIAEAYYRRALSLEPTLVIAQNNLAMLLARSRGNLVEARQLVRAAITANPQVGAFYDTLAFVEGQAKNFSAAADTMETAVRLSPQNLFYRVNLAQFRADAGEKEKASRVLTEIDGLYPTLPAAELQRINALRAQLAQQGSTAAR